MGKQDNSRQWRIVTMMIAFAWQGVFVLLTNASELSDSNSQLSNLQEKWRDMFNFRDITKDNILDMADVTLIQDNYVRIHNLTAEEGIFPKQRLLTISEQIIFKGQIRPLNISEYIRVQTRAYEANPDTFIRQIKAGYSDVASLFDINMNSMIEMDEHLRFLNTHGFTSDIDDLEFFKVAYNNTDSIAFAEVVEMWLQFETDETTNAKNDTIDQAIRTVTHEEL